MVQFYCEYNKRNFGPKPKKKYDEQFEVGYRYELRNSKGIEEFPSPVASWLNLPRLLRSFDENFSGYRSVDIVLVYSELSPSLKPRFIRELKSCSSLRQFQWLGDFEPDIANSLTCCKNLSRLRVMNCQDCEILMDTVSSLEHLQVIELVNCDLNAANIEKLKTWTQARLIVLAGTPVDEAQGKDIQAAMPDCFVLAFEFEEKY